MNDIQLIRQSSDYASASHIPSVVQWAPGEGGHVLLNKSTKKMFVACAVVKVYDHKLNCAPNGNYINPYLGSMDKAKYQLYSGKPDDALLAEDFGHLFSNLKKIQNMIAASSRHQDLLFTDLSAKMIWFARPVFVKRTKVVADPHAQVYLEDVTNPSATEAEVKPPMDDETRYWPVEEKYQPALRHIAPFYKAVPLRVYDRNVFVEPINVNDALRNATIQVHFSMRHTYLPNLQHDMFRVNIEQIIILREGGAMRTEFEDVDVRSGPVISTSSWTRKVTPVASTSKPSKVSRIGSSDTERSTRTPERQMSKQGEAGSTMRTEFEDVNVRSGPVMSTSGSKRKPEASPSEHTKVRRISSSESDTERSTRTPEKMMSKKGKEKEND